ELAEFVDGEFDHSFDLGGVADVGLQRLGLAARAANFRGHALRAFFVEVHHGNCGALLRKPLRGRLADTRSGSRYQRNLVFESHRITCRKLFSRNGSTRYRCDTRKAVTKSRTRISRDYLFANFASLAVVALAVRWIQVAPSGQRWLL